MGTSSSPRTHKHGWARASTGTSSATRRYGQATYLSSILLILHSELNSSGSPCQVQNIDSLKNDIVSTWMLVLSELREEILRCLQATSPTCKRVQWRLKLLSGWCAITFRNFSLKSSTESWKFSGRRVIKLFEWPTGALSTSHSLRVEQQLTETVLYSTTSLSYGSWWRSTRLQVVSRTLSHPVLWKDAIWL